MRFCRTPEPESPELYTIDLVTIPFVLARSFAVALHYVTLTRTVFRVARAFQLKTHPTKA